MTQDYLSCLFCLRPRGVWQGRNHYYTSHALTPAMQCRKANIVRAWERQPEYELSQSASSDACKWVKWKITKVIIPLFTVACTILKFNSLFHFFLCSFVSLIIFLDAACESEYDDVQQDVFFFILTLCVCGSCCRSFDKGMMEIG